jgi:hypothetical protein
VIEPLKYRFDGMKKRYADGGYRGELAENVKIWFGYGNYIMQRQINRIQSFA